VAGWDSRPGHVGHERSGTGHYGTATDRDRSNPGLEQGIEDPAPASISEGQNAPAAVKTQFIAGAVAIFGIYLAVLVVEDVALI